MRKSLIAAVMLAALSAPAFAADMAVKAAPQSPFAPASSGGWYVGLGTEGLVGASNVSSISFTSLSSTNLTAGGGSLGIDIGRIWSNCLLQTWCQLEVDGRWQNVSGTVGGSSVSSKYSISEEFDVGIAPITTVLAALNLGNPFPTFNPTSLLPAALSNSVAATPREYVGAEVDEMEIGGSFGAANGQTWAVAAGPKTGYRWATLNSAGTANGGSLNVYAKILFASRGVTFGNVFGATGAPVVTNASGSMSTIYAAGVKYDFGIPSR